MPLPNSAETDWAGYLIDGLSDRGPEFLRILEQDLVAAALPKVQVAVGSVNMWWQDGMFLDARSTLDGDAQCTVHAMPYGHDLFVGIAFAPLSKMGNYYKRMAALAFLQSVDRCVISALEKLRTGAAGEVRELTRTGKFGS